MTDLRFVSLRRCVTIIGIVVVHQLMVGCRPKEPEESQRVLIHSGSTSDLFVIGDGFLVAEDSNGDFALVKGGELGVNALMQLTIRAAGSEKVLSPPVVIPSDSTSVLVSMIGEVRARTRSNPHELQLYGQLACGLVSESLFDPPSDVWLRPKFGFEQTAFGVVSESLAVSGWKFTIMEPPPLNLTERAER